MISWTHSNHGLPIQFYKVQYREVTNSSSVQWRTANNDILAYIHSYEIEGLDNKMGRSSANFYMQRGGFRSPTTPVDKAVALSPNTIQLNWHWSSNGGVEAERFYVYFRAVTVEGSSRSVILSHLTPDTAWQKPIGPSDQTAPVRARSLRKRTSRRAEERW
ncbi:unnamed protein product [Leptidea sinapis]|uniref:Fibronectin type-III domain-containing protein n=1 Tax=Leptidea sinapis TaxID=189913 RepID=A0A5E4R3D6_9NEOP|nr:unnamed protein product [Leptidea sinapis]